MLHYPVWMYSGMDVFWDTIYDQCLLRIHYIRNIKDRILDQFFSPFVNVSLCRFSPFVEPEDKYHPTLILNLEIQNIK